MLTHPTFEQLNQLGLFGMAKAFGKTEASAEAAALTHPEWLALLLGRELAYRQRQKTWRPGYAMPNYDRMRWWRMSITAPCAASTGRYSRSSSPAIGSMSTTIWRSAGQPSPLHNAHLSMSLKFKRFLQGIAGRRTSQTAGCRRALHVASVQVGGADHPGRSLTELIRRELTIFDQTANGRRTNG